MVGPIQVPEAEVRYAEHRRQMALINEHDWKREAPVRRSLRVTLANALLVVARRVAPVQPEQVYQPDSLAG